MDIINKLGNKLIGYDKSSAIDLINKTDFNYRIVREDDIDYFQTCDLRFDRINLELDNNIVTKFDIG